jgi:hypothetical protein
MAAGVEALSSIHSELHAFAPLTFGDPQAGVHPGHLLPYDHRMFCRELISLPPECSVDDSFMADERLRMWPPGHRHYERSSHAWNDGAMMNQQLPHGRAGQEEQRSDAGHMHRQSHSRDSLLQRSSYDVESATYPGVDAHSGDLQAPNRPAPLNPILRLSPTNVPGQEQIVGGAGEVYAEIFYQHHDLPNSRWSRFSTSIQPSVDITLIFSVIAARYLLALAR